MERKANVEEIKEWTVMVFLAGDNNLSEECVWSLKEIFRAGVNDKIGLVVQIDPRAKRIYRFDVAGVLNETSNKKGRKVAGKLAVSSEPVAKQRYLAAQNTDAMLLVRNDDTDGKLLSRGHGLGNGRDTLSVEALKEFIRESKKLHKAHRYLLVLSGHSSGLVGNSFLVDGFPARALTLKGVRDAIKAAGRVDVVGMDSCAMGTVEVGHQLRDCADFLVSSEGFELNTGWPYFQILSALNKKPTIEPRQLAAKIVATHTAYYSDYLMAGVSTDLAACDLSRSEDLAIAVSQLAEQLKSKLPPDEQLPSGNGLRRARRVFVEDMPLAQRALADAVILAHWRAQSYRFEQHTDLYDFCELLEHGCRDKQVKEACKKIKKIIEGQRQEDGIYDGYVIKSCRSGGAFQHSHGVAIYFPWASLLRGYSRLSFAKATAWDEFLMAYVSKTRRRPRPGSGNGHPVLDADESATAVRVNPLTATRGADVLVPRVKNPPDTFFEDDCFLKDNC